MTGAMWVADGGPIQLPISLSPTLVITAVVVVVVVVAVLVGVAWWVWRRVRRSDRVARGVLQVQAAALPAGPRREIVGLRLTLRDHLAQTQRLLTELGSTVGVADVLVDLAARLRRAGDECDARLRLLSGEPDEGLMASVLPGLRTRVAELTRGATSLRATALRFADEADELTRAQLEQDLRDELAGLQAGLAEVRAMQPPGLRPPRDDAPDSGPQR